ncbi:MAG: hypothetical protein BM556_11965 [Bacteriovorax sp. MedPE-SWde]|nr:MAG: hypothetical protein BM556_11965 [Bacteriovorax sp. MedPE-SWde]
MEKHIEQASKLLKSEGINSTYLPQVSIFTAKSSTERAPLVYNQGVIFMLQGEKCIHTESDTFTYNRENLLVITVPMPLECQGIVKDNKPMIAVVMDIEISLLNQLINMMEGTSTISKVDKGDRDKGLFVSKLNESIKDALLRLLICLQDPFEASVLGNNIIKELIFYILKQREAAPLFALAMKNTNLSKIEIALKDVQSNYSKQFNVDALAKSVNMSVSSFHHTFKNVTSSSPIQYLKKIRLNKAKDFLTNEKYSVGEAATNVGYESVSQFNREFKRYFGVTPGSLNK